MGGSAIFRLKKDDPNINVIIEMLTEHGNQQIMAQRYLPEIKDGDKRILVVDGQVVDYCLARLPAEGETRGNLAAGGTGRPQPLTESDRALAEKIAPELVKRGLIFVGLDVIGNYLTEVNVTSPTCIREIDNAFDTDIAGMLMSAIEKKLENR
jgi:glutathione synthase